ncbi:MAG: hypothetical protein JW822_04340 [Spirochaetales bacterium]|nr:hypothetical protein [Spirochaetales bacterium]
MKHTALLVFLGIICLSFMLCKTTGQGKPVTADILIGNWETIKGDVEEIAFAIEEQGVNTYTSYLHQRIFETGLWEFKDNHLVVDLDTGESIVYVKATVAGDILTLRTQSGEESQYKKITP